MKEGDRWPLPSTEERIGRIEREMERLTATLEQGLMAIGANFQAIHKEIKKLPRRAVKSKRKERL